MNGGGAKLFGKYWINGGSKYSISGSLLSGETLGKKLNNAYNITKACELLHLGGFILLALINFKDYLDGDVVNMASNYLINILPIMSQRYIRNKIIPLRNRLKEREKLIFSSPQESLKEQ